MKIAFADANRLDQWHLIVAQNYGGSVEVHFRRAERKFTFLHFLK
jgi:hypothetical protein